MKFVVIIIFLLVGILSCSTNEEEAYCIGQKSITFIDKTRNRPLVSEIWYPTKDTSAFDTSIENSRAIFQSVVSIPNASIINKKFPLLLVSHGTGGNRFSLFWLIEKLVKEGFIVVSLDHYGNSSNNKIPREFLKWWERAIDIKYVLTQILNDKEFEDKIDTSRIGGVGFSLGGYTNIALAGGYVDRSVIGKLPPELPETDEVIDYANDSLIVASYKKFGDQVKDDRIKAFFVMAPAIGWGFHSEKQIKITSPVYIVAGEGDTNTPIEENALSYKRLIKTSKLHLFGEYVNHYVFLNEATEFGKKVAPKFVWTTKMSIVKKFTKKRQNWQLPFSKSTLI